MASERSDPGCHPLDERTAALVRVAALIALDAPPTAYRREVVAARAAGATLDEVVGALRAVGPSVGMARAVAAAPGLARALGIDLDRALEAVDDPSPGEPW